MDSTVVHFPSIFSFSLESIKSLVPCLKVFLPKYFFVSGYILNKVGTGISCRWGLHTASSAEHLQPVRFSAMSHVIVADITSAKQAEL
jgi:hypothetical protein